MTKKDAWLKPNGEIIEVGFCEHNEFAHDYLEQEMGSIENLYKYMDEISVSYPYEVLHERGWVRIKYNDSFLPKVEILGNCISLCELQRNTMHPAMNQTQLRIAKKICEEVGEEFHRAINDKRFW